MFRLASFVCLLVVTRAILFDSLTGGSASSSGTAATEQLGHYNVDRTKISVSGLSAGAAMAVQFHVAYSASIMGVGSVAGLPYHCAQGQVFTALGACMKTPSGVNTATLEAFADQQSSSGGIDPTSNLVNSKVTVIHGNSDSTVNIGASRKIADFYRHYHADVTEDFRAGMQHTFPTTNYGTSCSMGGAPYIGNCGYDGAYAVLNNIYGNLQRPTGSANGKFMAFNQQQFVSGSAGRKKRMLFTDMMNGMKQMMAGYQKMLSGMTGGLFGGSGGGLTGGLSSLPGMGNLPGLGGSGMSLSGMGGGSISLDSTGFAYIPTGCQNSATACKLHVSFHGCKQGRYAVQDKYARHTGFNEVAEANNIIMLYPQAVSSMPSNMNGCFDWWGYTGTGYDLKTGPQMMAVKRMIDHVSSGSP